MRPDDESLEMRGAGLPEAERSELLLSAAGIAAFNQMAGCPAWIPL